MLQNSYCEVKMHNAQDSVKILIKIVGENGNLDKSNSRKIVCKIYEIIVLKKEQRI